MSCSPIIGETEPGTGDTALTPGGGIDLNASKHAFDVGQFGERHHLVGNTNAARLLREDVRRSAHSG
jgi:hypothetical protein